MAGFHESVWDMARAASFSSCGEVGPGGRMMSERRFEVSMLLGGCCLSVDIFGEDVGECGFLGGFVV
jgi:hypothetical protein